MWEDEKIQNLDESIVTKVPTKKLQDIISSPSDNTKFLL